MTQVDARISDHDSIKRFPLEWPVGWKRTAAARRLEAPFGTKRTSNGRLTVQLATTRLELEVDRLGARNPVLSTNVSLRLDGRPRSDENPSDPGAAIYFSFKGKANVLACDRFRTVADNIAAIAGHIEALRRVERYGVGTIEQALAGYKALPADSAANWRAVFGFGVEARVTVDQVDTAYKSLAKAKHPDVGGTEVEMAHLNRARDYALMELQP
ncbi:MAG: J domain-containing protein [Acidobacteriota bacterium]